MSNELKSAWEIALEKLQGEEGEQVQELSDAQRESIASTRRKYRARIAEKELETQGRVARATQSGKFHQIEALHSQLAAERKRLEEKMENAVQEIRDGQAG